MHLSIGFVQCFCLDSLGAIGELSFLSAQSYPVVLTIPQTIWKPFPSFGAAHFLKTLVGFSNLRGGTLLKDLVTLSHVSGQSVV